MERDKSPPSPSAVDKFVLQLIHCSYCSAPSLPPYPKIRFYSAPPPPFRRPCTRPIYLSSCVPAYGNGCRERTHLVYAPAAFICLSSQRGFSLSWCLPHILLIVLLLIEQVSALGVPLFSCDSYGARNYPCSRWFLDFPAGVSFCSHAPIWRIDGRTAHSFSTCLNSSQPL